jgi:hypothetical protein
VVRERYSNTGRPAWHRKSQKAYKINNWLILLQIVAAFALCGVIWFGIERVVH